MGDKIKLLVLSDDDVDTSTGELGDKEHLRQWWIGISGEVTDRCGPSIKEQVGVVLGQLVGSQGMIGDPDRELTEPGLAIVLWILGWWPSEQNR